MQVSKLSIVFFFPQCKNSLEFLTPQSSLPYLSLHLKFVSPDSNWTYDHPFTASDALTTELRRTRGELGHIQGSCMTCVHPTARISTKSSCVWYIKKDGKFKARWSSIPVGDSDFFFLCLLLVTCWSHHFSKRFVKTSETRDLSKTRSTKKPLRSQHNRTKENNT